MPRSATPVKSGTALELPWRCESCEANGVVVEGPGWDPLQREGAIAEAHAIASPDCDKLRMRTGR